MRRGAIGGVAAGDDAVPGFEQPLDDGAAEKAAGAGDQYGSAMRDQPFSMK